MGYKNALAYRMLIRGVKQLHVDNRALFYKVQYRKFRILKLLTKIVEEIDPYKKNHAAKVYGYVTKVAKAMRLKKNEYRAVSIAALLHDIGKIAVDKRILNKRGKLTKEEFAIVQAHSKIGARIVAKMKELNSSAASILYHHAAYNGRGYPAHKFKHGQIPLGARLIAVADSYDAMTSDRPHRKAYSREHAIEELKKCAGEQFDPKIVKMFIKIIRDKCEQ